jgi:hypothetical protein
MASNRRGSTSPRQRGATHNARPVGPDEAGSGRLSPDDRMPVRSRRTRAAAVPSDRNGLRACASDESSLRRSRGWSAVSRRMSRVPQIRLDPTPANPPKNPANWRDATSNVSLSSPRFRVRAPDGPLESRSQSGFRILGIASDGSVTDMLVSQKQSLGACHELVGRRQPHHLSD